MPVPGASLPPQLFQDPTGDEDHGDAFGLRVVSRGADLGVDLPALTIVPS